jgi:hypothetical protein
MRGPSKIDISTLVKKFNLTINKEGLGSGSYHTFLNPV